MSLPYPLGRRCCGAPDATTCHQYGLCRMEGLHPDSSERALFLRLVSSLLDSYRPEGVLIWLDTRNRHLGSIRPRDLIAAGEWQRVLDEADRLPGGPR